MVGLLSSGYENSTNADDRGESMDSDNKQTEDTPIKGDMIVLGIFLVSLAGFFIFVVQ